MVKATNLSPRLVVYERVFRNLRGSAGPARLPHLRQLAGILAQDSWSPHGITLHVDGHGIAIEGFDANNPQSKARIENPGWTARTLTGKGRRIDIDAVAPFSHEVDLLLRRILLPLEEGQMPEPTEPNAPDPSYPNILVADKRGEPKTAAPPGQRPIDYDNWKDRFSRARPELVDGILRDVQYQVFDNIPDAAALQFFIPRLVALARRCEVEYGQLDATIKIWFAILDASSVIELAFPDNTDHMVSIMIDGGKRFWNPDNPKGAQNWPATVKVFRGILERARTTDPAGKRRAERLIIAMGDVAHRATDLEKQRSERNFDGALALWTTLLDHHQTLEQIGEGKVGWVLGTLRKVALGLTDLRIPDQYRDPETAVRLWTELLQRSSDIEQYEPGISKQIVRNMMDAANRGVRDAQIADRDSDQTLTVILGLLKLRPIIERIGGSFVDSAIAVVVSTIRWAPASALERVLEFKSGDAELDTYLHATALYTANNFSAALDRTTRGPKDSLLVLCRRSAALHKLLRLEEAEVTANRVLALTRDRQVSYWDTTCRAIAFTYLGHIAVDSGQYQLANAYYSEAAKLAEIYQFMGANKMLVRMARIEMRHGNTMRARDFIAAALAIDPDHVQAQSLQRELSPA